MMKGMYIAASGMSYQIQQLNEVSANLANASTAGYKKTALIGESFENLVHQFAQPTAQNRAGVGVRAAGQARIDGQGTLVKTTNPLNVALSGPGFFQVQNNDGTVMATRNGDFRMDAQGFLATHAGERVLGVDNQPIQLGASGSRDMRIRQDGTIMGGTDVIGQIKVVDAQEANSPNFPVSNADAAAVANGYNVEQGYLENSNVSVISELVNMVTISKAFNFNQKAITTQDNLLNKTVNDLGRVQ